MEKWNFLLFMLFLILPIIWILIYNYLIVNQRFISLENTLIQQKSSIESNTVRILNLENQKLECDILELEENKLGLDVCKNKGYDICLQAYKFLTHAYYSSTDSTCVGIQDEDVEVQTLECGQVAQVFYNHGACSYLDKGGVNGKEPVQGDTSTLEWFKVACCKKV
jgi:hypothetical protein